MKKFKKGLLSLALTLLLGGAALVGAAQHESPHEVEAATGTGYWGICGTIGKSSTWADDVQTVADDGTSTMTVALNAGNVFKFRANGAWDKNIGYSDLTGSSSGVNFTGSTSALTAHFGDANDQNNVKVLIGGNYTFTFPDGSATTWTYGYQYGMTIAYEAFAVSYTVTPTIVVDGVEQPQLVKPTTFTEEGKTLADLNAGIYGYEIQSYVIGEQTIAAADASTYTVSSDIAVTINYATTGTKNTYSIDYSAAAESFGENVYIHYWVDGGVSTTWPGLIATASSGVATVDIPDDADYIILNNNSGVQTVNISLANATGNYVVSGTQDTEDHYTGAWGATTYVVTINRTIGGVAQAAVTESVASGTTYGNLAKADVYGYTISGYTVGGAAVQATDEINSAVTVDIAYTANADNETYSIDYTAVLTNFGADAYVYYWRDADETAGVEYVATSWPGIKLAPSNGIATVVIPADADAMILNNGADPAVQTANISLSGATQRFVVGTTTDASGHYEGSWQDGITVTIIKSIYTVIQDPVTETVASGTTLAELTKTEVYGWDIQRYEIGGETVEDSTQITASTTVTVIYTEAEGSGSMSYTIDFSAFKDTIGDYFYAHIWKNNADGTVEASSDIKLPINDPVSEKMVNVVIPADATAFLIWNSPDSGYRSWQTLDIVATGLQFDAYRITGIDETYGNYYGKWDSNVDDFVAKFFEHTNICRADETTDTAALAEIWATIVTEWNALTDLQKTNINRGTADYSEEAVGTINGLLARYDYIVSKYSSTITGITDFMGRAPASQVYYGGMSEEDTGRMTAILVFAGSIVVGVAIGVFFVQKRKENRA